MGTLTPDSDPAIAAAQWAFHARAADYGNLELADVLGLGRNGVRTIIRICTGEQRPPPGMADDLADHIESCGMDSATDRSHITALRAYAKRGRELKEQRNAKA